MNAKPNEGKAGLTPYVLVGKEKKGFELAGVGWLNAIPAAIIAKCQEYGLGRV